jgi:hypothetical protein
MRDKGVAVVLKVLILTEEFVFDLGSRLGWRKLTVPCLLPVTNVFHLKIH